MVGVHWGIMSGRDRPTTLCRLRFVADEGEAVVRPAMRRESVSIDTWIRWVCGVLGLAGAVAGTYAIFVTEVEAGPVALILFGALFLLVGLGGTMPSRLKIGDNEAEWQREVGQIVAEVVDEAPVESRSRIEAQVNELAVIAPRAAAAPRMAINYERVVERLLFEAVEIVEKIEPKFVVALNFNQHFTKGIEPPGEDYTVVPVEIRSSQSTIDYSYLTTLHDRAQGIKGTKRAKILLLTPGDPGAAALFSDVIYERIYGEGQIFDVVRGLQKALGIIDVPRPTYRIGRH